MSAVTPEKMFHSRTVPQSGDLFKRIVKIVLAVLITLFVLIELYPIVWLLLSSLKGPTEFNLRPIYALPEGFYWQNFVDAWTRGKMNTYFLNSVLVVFPSIFLIVTLSTSAAFGLEILKWRWNNTVLLIFLTGILIPVQMILLPLFTIYFRLDLINSRLALILTYTAFGLPLTVFLLAGFFKSVPREVLEAAVMDGANIYQTYFRVALPMVANSIVTVTLVQFFFIWNDLILSLTFINNTELRTIQTGLLSFVGQFGRREWGPTFASLAMTVVPLLLLYLILNNKVIAGLTAGSVKG